MHEMTTSRGAWDLRDVDVVTSCTKAYVSRLVTALADAATGHEAARHGGVLTLRPSG